MICSDCPHAIVRKFNNGVNEFEVQVVCGVDHFIVTSMRKSISECNRMERVVPPEYILAEQNAKDAMLPPLQEVAKYRGWPKGKPRGKRG